MFAFRKPLTLPTAENALPGRPTAVKTAATHFVNGHRLAPPFPDGIETALFGLGCFWGADEVLAARRRLCDGRRLCRRAHAEPDLRGSLLGLTGHNEVVLVAFDPANSYEALLKTFWESHDPTQGMRQGADVGTQIAPASMSPTRPSAPPPRRAGAPSRGCWRSRASARSRRRFLDRAAFYYAEGYHQQYLAKNPNGYCGLGGTGVSCPIGIRVAA